MRSYANCHRGHRADVADGGRSARRAAVFDGTARRYDRALDRLALGTHRAGVGRPPRVRRQHHRHDHGRLERSLPPRLAATRPLPGPGESPDARFARRHAPARGSGDHRRQVDARRFLASLGGRAAKRRVLRAVARTGEGRDRGARDRRRDSRAAGRRERRRGVDGAHGRSQVETDGVTGQAGRRQRQERLASIASAGYRR